MLAFLAICVILSAIPAVLVALAQPEPEDQTPHLVTSPRPGQRGY